MKLKKAFSYRMHDAFKAIRTYYLVMVCVFAFGIILINTFGSEHGTIGGFEMAGMTFIFILGLNSFKEYFYQFLQHGVSRKTGFYSYGITLVAIAPIMALVDSVICVICSQITNYHSAFEQCYGALYLSGRGISYYVAQFFWSFALYLAAGMGGYLITILYYRMNKAVKIAVSVGVPVFCLTIFPSIDYIFFQGRISNFLSRIASLMLGMGEELHPYYSVLTCIGAAVVLSALAYLMSRKAAVKKA